MKQLLLTLGVVIINVLQTASAITVQSKGNGKLLIQDAMGSSGTQPEIVLIEFDEKGHEQQRPVADAKDINVEYNGNDIIVTDLTKGKHPRQILIKRLEKGSQQIMRMSLSGGHSSTIMQSGSSAGNKASISQNDNDGMTINSSIQSVSPRIAPSLPPTLRGHLINKNFHNRDFKGQSLSRTRIVNSRFHNVNLQGANVSQSKIINTEFVHSNLSEVNFKQARMANVSFYKANLSKANFEGTSLRNVDFNGSNLTGAIWVNGEKCEQGSIGTCKIQRADKIQ